MKKFVFLLVFLLLLTGCAVRQDSSTATESDDQGSGENTSLSGMSLNILGSYHEDMVKRLAEMFEAETGCRVSYIRLPTGEAVSKLLAEKNNPTFHVYIGGTVDAHESLKFQNLLTVYRSPYETELPAEYTDPDGVWKAQYLETLSIGVNTERWAEAFPGQPMPTTLEELLNPALKGEIITPDPYTSGTGYTFLSSVLQLMGEEKGWAYIEAFNGQVGQYTTSGYTAAERTGLGEFLICVNFLSDQLIINTSGYPLESTVFEGAGWSMCPVSIVTGSGSEVAAKEFIDFCISKRALDALVELGHCVAVREDCIAPQGGSKLSELNFNRAYNPIQAAVDKDEILERFGTIVD